jgi:hypothetical protein
MEAGLAILFKNDIMNLSLTTFQGSPELMLYPDERKDIQCIFQLNFRLERTTILIPVADYINYQSKFKCKDKQYPFLGFSRCLGQNWSAGADNRRLQAVKTQGVLLTHMKSYGLQGVWG